MLKFELFITSNDKQESFDVGEKPIIFGIGSACDINLGDSDPKIKAVIQKEEDYLLVKVFDTKFPIEINNKKYKTAKIKKSVFFKIGNVDIIANIEENKSIEKTTSQQEPEVDELPDYVDEGMQTHLSTDNTATTIGLALPKEALDLPEIEEEITQTQTQIISADFLNPSVDDVNDIVTESRNKIREEHRLASNELNKDSNNSVLKTQDAETKVEEITAPEDFKFNILFDESNYKIKLHQSYSDKSLDFSSYIDLKDETIVELPTPEIHIPAKSKSIHITHMNNGTVINDKYFKTDERRIFLSDSYGRRHYMQVYDCSSNKTEFIFNRSDKTYVVALNGYDLQIIKNGEVSLVDEKTIELVDGLRVILSKGTSQIIVEHSMTPPKVKTNRFFNVEEDMLKSVAISWAFAVLVLALVVVFPPVKQEKTKKELVVVYKRKKVVISKKIPQPPSEEVAKSEVMKETPKEKVSKPAPSPVEKVVKKDKPKKTEVVQKKIKKVSARKKPVKKMAKNKPVKRKTKARKVVKVKAFTPAPKKQYKFNFGSKMASVVDSNTNTKLKAAKNKKNVNVANAMNSASSVTSKFNSKNFGTTNTKVARFAAGGPAGKRSTIGTKGLSGKTRSTTAYIEANTKILGAMDPELIRKIMREYIPQFRHCYQRELISNQAVAGVFDLEFQINSRGKGIGVGVKSNGKGFSKNGIHCLKRVVKLIKFPRPKGGGLVDVKQPMNFYKQ